MIQLSLVCLEFFLHSSHLVYSEDSDSALQAKLWPSGSFAGHLQKQFTQYYAIHRFSPFVKVSAESYVLGHAVKKAPQIVDAEKTRITVSDYIAKMCVCVCLCVHVCVSVCTYVCLCVYVCLSVRVRVCMCTCMYVHACMYVYMCVYMYVRVCVHVCIHVLRLY